ncbi:MAG: hypothetical protein QG657_4885 [Acidobacteriota bacterium]|nr:hypothetical protein [Acidobacteriota bacterium]
MSNILLKPLRKFFLDRALKKMIKSIETDLLDDFLEILLKVVRLALILDPHYRRNIQGFNARYAFQDEEGQIAASAIFQDGKMKVKKYKIEDTNVTVFFKNGKALWEFLMSKNPDVFAFVLESKIRYEGNPNYIMKFGYMAKHLQVMFGF